MKDTIVIGDIHGRTIWKQILDQNPHVERVIFIGDYVDTHEKISGAEQLANLENILHLRRSKDIEVITLLGNHDYNYWPGHFGTCSGYQPTMAPSFLQCFGDNKELFQLAYVNEHKHMFTHAGISKKWLESVDIAPTHPMDITEQINDLFRAKPAKISFFNGDWEGYGDHVMQPPTWIRPRALEVAGLEGTQIVGHTQQRDGVSLYASTSQKYYYIDTFGFIKQYLYITKTGDIQVKTITNKEIKELQKPKE